MESSHLNDLLYDRLIIDTYNNSLAKEKLVAEGYPSQLNDDGFIETHSKEAIQNPGIISRLLVYNGFPPTRLLVKKEDLESYFLKLIKTKGDTLQ